MASRAQSLSYRSADSYNSVRVPNFSSYTKSTEIGPNFRARELKRVNGHHFDDLDSLGPHPQFDKIRSNIARGRSKTIFSDQTRSLSSLVLNINNKRHAQNETLKENKSKTKTLGDCLDRIIRPLGQPNYVGMLEGKSKSFVLPDRYSPRSAPQIGSRSTRIEDLLPLQPQLPSPSNHYHHHHHQRTPPSSTSSSTNHIKLMPLSSPSSTALMSPSRVRAWHLQ